MSRSIRTALALAAGALLSLSTVPAALACSCAPPPDAATAASVSAIVAEATVVSGPLKIEDGSAVEYNFDVLRTFKGEPGAQLTVTTAVHSAACGRSYTKGSTWLLYTRQGDDGVVRDNLCSRSRTSDRAEEDFAVLTSAVTSAPTEPDGEQAPEEGPAVEGEPGPEGEPSAEPEVEVAPEPEPEGATEPEPAADEDAEDDPVAKKDGCNVAGGVAPSLIVFPLIALLALRRRSAQASSACV